MRYIIKRFTYGLMVLFGVVLIIFALFNALPDPARLTQGQRTDMQSIELVRKELGLDKAWYIKLQMYLNDLSVISFHEDNADNQKKYEYSVITHIGENVMVFKVPYLRRSYQNKRKVLDIILDAVPKTIILAVTSMVIATVIGILLGILSAVYKDTFWDKLAIFLSTGGFSTPSYVAAIIIAYVFGFLLSDYTGLNMRGNMYEITIDGKVLMLKNLILPAITLGIRPVCIIMLLTRSSVLDVLSQDYIRTAIAKGLSKKSVLFKHTLRNSLNPVLTATTGWFASLLAGSFFVEIIFDWKGLGYYTVKGIENLDFPVVMGSILFIATSFVIINILVDVLYTILDPRVEFDN